MASPHPDYKTFFEVTIKQFQPEPQKVITVGGNETAKRVSQILNANSIYSVVVEQEKGEKYLGLLDFGDLISFIISSFYEGFQQQIGSEIGKTRDERLHGLSTVSFNTETELSKKRKNSEGHTLDLKIFSELHESFEKQTASSLVNFSKKNKFVALPETTPLYEIMKTFSSGIHRVPIVDSSGNIVHYLTQSGIMRFLAKNLSKLSPVSYSPLADLGFQPKSVVSISENSIALEAFAKMHEYQMSGLPLLDPSGHFVGAISARDIKYALLDFTRFLLPVRDYVAAVRNESTFETNPTIYCKLSDPLADVIKKLIAVKIHRLFVVEDTKKFIPIGVVSHQDILTAMLKQSGL